MALANSLSTLIIMYFVGYLILSLPQLFICLRKVGILWSVAFKMHQVWQSL